MFSLNIQEEYSYKILLFKYKFKMLYLGEKKFSNYTISSLLKFFQWAWPLPTTIYDPNTFWVLSKKNLQWCYSSPSSALQNSSPKNGQVGQGISLFYLNSSCTKQNVHIVSGPLSLEVPGHESSASISLLNIYHWINKVSHRQLWMPRRQRLLIRQMHHSETGSIRSFSPLLALPET